jgi:hypothetical protein
MKVSVLDSRQVAGVENGRQPARSLTAAHGRPGWAPVPDGDPTGDVAAGKRHPAWFGRQDAV